MSKRASYIWRSAYSDVFTGEHNFSNLSKANDRQSCLDSLKTVNVGLVLPGQ